MRITTGASLGQMSISPHSKTAISRQSAGGIAQRTRLRRNILCWCTSPSGETPVGGEWLTSDAVRSSLDKPDGQRPQCYLGLSIDRSSVPLSRRSASVPCQPSQVCQPCILQVRGTTDKTASARMAKAIGDGKTGDTRPLPNSRGGCSSLSKEAKT